MSSSRVPSAPRSRLGPPWPRPARRPHAGSLYRLLYLDLLPRLSQHHSTAPPSPKRYKVEGTTTFSELRKAEVQLPRIPLPRTWVNKVAHKLQTPSRSGGCSRVD